MTPKTHSILCHLEYDRDSESLFAQEYTFYIILVDCKKFYLPDVKRLIFICPGIDIIPGYYIYGPGIDAFKVAQRDRVGARSICEPAY